MGGCSKVENKAAHPTREAISQKEFAEQKDAGKEPEEKQLETRSLDGLAISERNAIESLAKLASPGRGLRFGRDLDLPGGPVVALGIDKASEQVMKELTAFPQLKSLMFCCPVTDAELTKLPRIESLQELFLGGGPFGKSNVSDTGLKYLEGLTALTRLQVGDTTLVTQSGIRTLQKTLPKCRIDAFEISSEATAGSKSSAPLPAHLEADLKQLQGEWNLVLQPIPAWDEKLITFWIRFEASGSYVLGFRDPMGKQVKLLDGDFTLQEVDKQREVVFQEKAKPGGGVPYFKSTPYKIAGDLLTIEFNAIITLDLPSEESSKMLKDKKEWKRGR